MKIRENILNGDFTQIKHDFLVILPSACIVVSLYELKVYNWKKYIYKIFLQTNISPLNCTLTDSIYNPNRARSNISKSTTQKTIHTQIRLLTNVCVLFPIGYWLRSSQVLPRLTDEFYFINVWLIESNFTKRSWTNLIVSTGIKAHQSIYLQERQISNTIPGLTR